MAFLAILGLRDFIALVFIALVFMAFLAILGLRDFIDFTALIDFIVMAFLAFLGLSDFIAIFAVVAEAMSTLGCNVQPADGAPASVVE